MYSESDVQSAVDAGVITAEAADAFRNHSAAARNIPSGDEEHFRLITGFNDIFVSIACLLVVFAAFMVGIEVVSYPVGAALVAAASWAMAEPFTRRRRMALPSIILLLAFILSLGVAVWSTLEQSIPKHEFVGVDIIAGQRVGWTSVEHYPWEHALMVLVGAATAGAGALLHWRRFHVSITIAAAVAALVLFIFSAAAAASNENVGHNFLIAPAALVCGLAVFFYAMRWDMSDRARDPTL